jgi:hypothetical protein
MCDTADGGGFHDCGNIIIPHSIIILSCIVLGPLLFSVFINDLCDAVAHSKYILLLTISKSTEPSSLPKNTIYYSLTLTPYKVCALRTV